MPSYPPLVTLRRTRFQETLDEVMAALAEAGVRIPASAYLFSNDPAHARPWNPDWLSQHVGPRQGGRSQPRHQDEAGRAV